MAASRRPCDPRQRLRPDAPRRGPGSLVQCQREPDRQHGCSSREHSGSRGQQGRLEFGRHTRERGVLEFRAVKRVPEADR